MALSIGIVVLFTLSIDIFITASVGGFLQAKFNLIQLLRLILAPALPALLLLLAGVLVGTYSLKYISYLNHWYAATLMFVLALKLLYNGISMHKIRNTINPLSIPGLLAISTFISLNALFAGISFGMLQIQIKIAVYALIIFIVASILGYLTGLKIKKLFAGRIEFLAAFIYLLCAIYIIVKL